MAPDVYRHADLPFAKMARQFAEELPQGADGKTALEAFALAIEATNAKQYPKGDKAS